MKTAGLFLVLIGLLITLFTRFTNILQENVADRGRVEIISDDERTVNWQPYVGMGAMGIGGAVLLRGRQKSRLPGEIV